MKKCLMMLFAMAILQWIATDCMAQTSRKTVTKETYVEEVFHEGTSQLLETRYWDSYQDYLIGQELKSSDGWVCGWGEATGNIHDREEAGSNLKQTAQDAARNYIAGQMASEIRKYVRSRRITGTNNGLEINKQITDAGFESIIKDELPPASKACSYRLKLDNKGTVTIVVGIGIDMKSYNAIKKGYCPEEDTNKDLEGLKDAFNF